MFRIRGVFLGIALILLSLISLQGCAQGVKQYKLKVIESYAHDRGAYTQGLFFHEGKFYESCGQYGQSTFRINELKTGRVLRRLDFDPKYFVEGSCILDGRIYILTWKEHKCFVYDAESWKYLGSLPYYTEGWGLTTNGKELIMSDGSATLSFLDPMTFAVKKRITVTENKRNILFLNELEYINGDIWCNIYGEDRIVIVSETDGKVKGSVDCKGLLPYSLRKRETDVLNGIAYNPADSTLWLTGKYWPKLYKVEIEEKK